MTELISTEDMGIVDENTNYLGIPTLLLMENAGSGLARILLTQENIKNKTVLIFAGLGNNGGDSFVMARHLANQCKTIHVILAGDPTKIRTEISKINWNALQKLDFSINTTILRDSSELSHLRGLNPDIVVDGLLGTGVRGKLREPIASLISFINELPGLKIAVDVPSGMNPDTGEVIDIAVKADLTITFHKIKHGLIKNEKYAGKIIPIKIGIPPEAEIIIGPGDLRVVTRIRPAESHKGDYGKILVIGGGGGKYYSGAPALSGLAALRTGADLVNIATPSKIANVIRNYSPDLIVRDLPGNYLNDTAIAELNPLLKWATSVIIGPGLGLNPETQETILVILKKIQSLKLPVLVDADAIKAMVKNNTILHGCPAVLTPHFGEYKILTGIDLSKIPNSLERLNIIKTSAQELGVTLLVKGKEDFVSDGVSAKINRTGTPAMTTGGTGDILAGIVGCLLGQHYSPFRSAAAGAFINGLAGEYAEKQYFGPHLLASDLIEYIPKAMFLS
ncbi:MAG: NAD(P)H-hydrate dehydratase [Candidatus Helarchaeota archaeon]